MTDIKDLNNKMKESGNSSNLSDDFTRLFCSIFPGLNNQPNNIKEETTTNEQEQGN